MDVITLSRSTAPKEECQQSKLDQNGAAWLRDDDSDGAERIKVAGVQAGSTGKIQIGIVHTETTRASRESGPFEAFKHIARRPTGEVVRIRELQSGTREDAQCADSATCPEVHSACRRDVQRAKIGGRIRAIGDATS